MPFIDPRPFGGPAYTSGAYGNPSNPLEWQHQPGDHSDTGILPLLTPVSASGGVAFGFGLSGTATQTFSASGGVAFGFALSGTATHTAADPPTFCDYDYADDTYDNATDTYDCGAVSGDGGRLPAAPAPRRRRQAGQPDQDDEEALIALLLAM